MISPDEAAEPPINMKNFFKGFVYAFRGLITCVKEERNFRFHLVVAFHLFVYLPFFELTRGEVCVIVTLCGLVISLEALNSAVERAVDCTGEVSPRAGAAKDIAAGAVLVAAIASAVCGILLLWQPSAFVSIARFWGDNPLVFAMQAVLGIVSCRFVFHCKKS